MKGTAEIKWIDINVSYTLADHHFIFVVPKDTIQTYLVTDITILARSTIITLYTS